MAVQDLTPQLRTRLSRVERVVGWFVLLATLLLLAGFGYYFYATAQRKGWFITKIPYYTYLRNATGLKVGDPVKMMGFDVGEITKITANPPAYWYVVNNYNVFVRFVVLKPYYGYIWTDSGVRLEAGNFLGARVLEITRGTNGLPTVEEKTTNAPLLVLADKPWPKATNYIESKKQTNGFYLPAMESPALTERFEQIANQLQQALPNFLELTNRIGAVLTNANQLTANLSKVSAQLPPLLSNAVTITGFLTNRQGGLGQWLIPTNLEAQLSQTIGSAHHAIQTADTNLARLSDGLTQNLENLAGITSNLRRQVENNSFILSRISSIVVDADNFIQGLKHHWLLRSAFKTKTTNAPPASPPAPRAGKRWQE